MRRPLDLALPRSRSSGRRRTVALAISVGVHVVFFLVGSLAGWIPRLPEHVVLVPATTRDTVPLVLFHKPPAEPRLPSNPEPQLPRQRAARPTEAPTPPVFPEPAPRPEPVPIDTGTPPVTPKPTPAPAPAPSPAPAPAQPQPAQAGRIGPGLGEGKLWVRPLPLPPRELARRLSRSNAELVDSAVTAIVQGFLDSLANDPSSRGVPMPDWTGSIGGKKFGLDSSSLYVAGLKIPAAILALLPISAGNIDQNRAYDRLLELKADIEQAARRADNLAEFKERIKEIRLRKEREDEFERHRKEAPPSAPAQPPAPSPAPPSPSRDSSAMAQEK